MGTRNMLRLVSVSLFVIFDLFVPFVASAQTTAQTPRVDATVAVGLLTGAMLGEADADLRARGGGPYRLFATASEFALSIPVEVRLGYALSAHYGIEVRGAWSRPELRTTISEDVEGAPAFTSSENVDQYVVDGVLLVSLSGLRVRNAVPVASFGIGWVRQVHEGLAATQDGVSYHGGVGVKYPLAMRSTGFIRGLGLRADGGLLVLSKGVQVERDVNWRFQLTGGAYLLF